MQLRQLTLGALVAIAMAAPAAAQDAGSAIAAASKAMGVDTLTSITYSGTARNGQFGQSKSIGEPMGPVNVTLITQYTRTINFGPSVRPRRPRLARDGSDAAAGGPGRAASAGRRVQPEHHRRAGRRQLGAGTQHLDDAVGVPEGRGRQRGHRPAAGRPAGHLVLAGKPQVTVGTDLHRDGLRQRSESRHQGGDAGRQRGRRRPAGGVRVRQLPEHERRAGSGADRPEAGWHGDVRRGHHRRHAESAEPCRAARAASARRRSCRRRAAGRPRRRACGRAAGGGRTAARRAPRRGRLQDRRQLHLARHRHGRTTSWWSRAARTTHAARRSWPRPSRRFPASRSASS